MSIFSDDRAAIAEALEGLPVGWEVYDHLPGRAIPPCFIVLHGSPLVSRETTDPIGSATARYEVWAVTAPAANDVEVASVEDGTEQAIEALMAAGFDFETVDQPVSFDLNGTAFLAVVTYITTPIHFERKAA